MITAHAFPIRSACWGWILLGLLSAAVAGEFRVGTGAVTINPPLGTPLAGYYSERGCQGVLDDLQAKAAVLDDGQSKVAFVVCDLIGPRVIQSSKRASWWSSKRGSWDRG